MKRNYVSPLMFEVNVETGQMLAASAPEYRGSVVNSNDDQSNVRGQWGNLWQ